MTLNAQSHLQVGCFGPNQAGKYYFVAFRTMLRFIFSTYRLPREIQVDEQAARSFGDLPSCQRDFKESGGKMYSTSHMFPV